MMSSKSTLPVIKVASPCSARWDDMAGDERSRLCARCEKRVYNLSAMSEPEVSALLSDTGSKKCVRFYQRRDGRVLLENCPIGTAKAKGRLKVFFCSIVAGLGLFLGWLMNAQGKTPKEMYRKAEWVWEDAYGRVRAWFGVQPPAIVMGEMIAVPPASSSTAPDLDSAGKK